MGLLGDNFDDPKTMATLALAGGLMGGRTFGQGLLGGLQSYQGSLLGAQQLQEAQQKSALEKFQLQRLQDWQKITMGDGSGQQASPQQAQPAQMANTQQAPPMQQSPSFDFANPDAQQPQSIPQSIPQGVGGQMPSGQQGQGVQQPPTRPGFEYALPGLTDQQSRTIAANMQPGEYMKMYADKAAPQTDITKLMAAQGIDTRSPIGQMLLQQATVKANYVAPTRIGEGAYSDPVTGIQGLPTTAPPGYINVRSPNGTWSTQKVANGLDAVEAAKTAEKTGTAAATPSVAYDSKNNPIFSTGKQDLLRATGNPPAGSGLPVNDVNAGAREIARMQASLPNIADPASKVLVQQEITRLQGQSAQYGTPSVVTPVPQMGAIANSDASQKASADTMHQSYAKLQAGNSTANAALEMIEKMKVLASNKNPLLTAGVLGTNQSAVNPDAAEYEKQRANLITLIAAQSGTNGTDAGRALTGDSVPDFGKPNKAIQDGLGSLKNQLISQTQLKSNVMTPSYKAGDSKAYTDLENGYDQNITPSMIPLLTMPAGQSRGLLLKSAANDPAMKARLVWAAEHGLLK